MYTFQTQITSNVQLANALQKKQNDKYKKHLNERTNRGEKERFQILKWGL